MPFISASAISPYNVNSNLVGEKAFTFGNAYKTFGGTDYTSFTGLSALNSVTTASIHCWVKFESNRRFMIGSNNSSTDRFVLTTASNNIFLITTGGVFGQADISSYIGVPVLVSMIFDGTETGDSNRLKLRINGVAVALSYTGTIGTTTYAGAGSDFMLNKLDFTSTIGEAEYCRPVITLDASSELQCLAYYNSGNGAFAQDCFTNILAAPNTNQADGATTMDDLIGTSVGTLNNSSTPPAYFVPFI